MAFARRWIALVAPVAVLMVVISMAAPLARGQEADAPHPAHILLVEPAMTSATSSLPSATSRSRPPASPSAPRPPSWSRRARPMSVASR